MKAANMTLENEGCGYSAEPTAYVKQTLAAAGQTLHIWKHRARSRRALAKLSPRMLDDAGIEPKEALHEAAKPFWRE